MVLSWWYDSLVWEGDLPSILVETDGDRSASPSYQKDYDFTVDWFSMNIPVWEKVLKPYMGQPKVHYLEIGLYEGMSALWMLENVLTDETAHLTGIDPFLGDYKQRLFSNLERSGFSDKATVITGFSQVVLRAQTQDRYDIIYIDGSHATKDVLEDAVLSWRLLKNGGILIFDDYRWVGLGSQCEFDSSSDYPKVAIDSFATCYQGDFEVIHNSDQLILRKTEQ